jgi:competence protein ComEC
MPAALLAGVLAGVAPEHRIDDVALGALRAIAGFSLDALAAAARFAPAPWPSQPAPLFVGLALATLFFVVRATTPWRRIAGALAIVALLALAPAAAIEPRPPRVVVLDVGQGDAVLVQGRSAALLVDAGVALPGGADLGHSVVVPALRALGVGRLDLLVASHADLDHRGGLQSVLRALPVARLWLPHGAIDDPAFAATIAAAQAAGAQVEEQGAAGAPLEVGDLRVEPLWPPPGDDAASRNDRSLTLRVRVGGRSVLLPGDLEDAAERRLLASGVALHADVLKLAHHGSRTSSSAAWLAAVGGSVAVASAPRFGRFGMPHPEVVARAVDAGYALWWTGRDGAVLVGLDPTLPVRGWRQAGASRSGPDRGVH